MSSKRYSKVEDTLDNFDDSWEEEIERLKHEIKRAEKRIFLSEQGRLAENAKFLRGCDRQDNDSVRSTMPADISSAPLVERIIRDSKLSTNSVDSHLTARNHNKVTDVSAYRISKEPLGENWVSPYVSKARHTKRDIFSDQFGNCLESSFDFDCGSSIISLDFGLVSPRKNWCSPPQRIERAQNREWFSPHRVINRPNPENSPGNWISMKESCATPRHSPTLGVKNLTARAHLFNPAEAESRPLSQSTYVVQEAPPPPEVHPKDNQPTRKISVLERFAPERIASTKKRIGEHGDALERNLLPTKEKIRRIVNTSGHVVKISLLDDFEAPALGRAHEKTSETTETECHTPCSKIMKGITKKKKRGLSARSSPSALKPKVKRKRKERKEEDGIAAGHSSRSSFNLTSSRSAGEAGVQLNKHHEEDKTKEIGNDVVNVGNVDNVDNVENVENIENLENMAKVEDVESVDNVDAVDMNNMDKSMHKMIQNLEEILRPMKEDTDKREGILVPKSCARVEKPKPKKLKQDTVVIEEKPLEPPEKRKRNVDPKAVREFIKNQKQKRIEQVKMEKQTKDAEREARKKKLEELRLKTIKLASQSKKKKSPKPAADEVKAGTEDDVTMSLGLKQVIPKVSYNESVSKLKKKTVHQKSQQPPPESQLSEGMPEASESEENADDNSLLRVELPVEEVNRTDDLCLKKPEESAELKTTGDLNVTLKKLAESLHLKLDQKAKEIRSLASKSAKEPPLQVPSHETSRTVQSVPEENRQLITVDMETIKTLKSDIKKISENFKVLHEIIAEKGDVSGRASLSTPRPAKPQCQDRPRELPDWLRTSMPPAYPYNVFSAFQKKMNLKPAKELPSVSQGSRAFAEPYVSNRRESEFERLSVPSDRLRSVKEILGSFRSTSCGAYEENYFSVKDDSGSEMSSSILDSEKQSLTSVDVNKRDFANSSKPTGPKDSLSSSIITEITSRSARLKESKAFDSKAFDSSSSESSCDDFEKRENLTLTTPDIKLISNDLHEEKVNGCATNLNLHQTVCERIPEELNNSEKSCKEKTDSTVAEVMDNPSGSDRRTSQEQGSGRGESRSLAQGGETAVQPRRTFFQPELLHLQFQAELNLIEKFQQSLSQFLEAEKSKTSSEVNKIVYEKAISTEELVDNEDRAVQAPYSGEDSGKITPEETDSVATEINAVESVKTDQPDSPNIGQDVVSELAEKFSSSSKETLKGGKPKDLENSEASSDLTEISLHTFNSTMKDEELRSEHLLALIRLREKTLTEKVKAELTFLEMKKRMLKERSGDEEQNISAIKKKQRGILLKYQSEKEEIERLKKMHKVASEERKTVIKRQKQIQQMQISDRDMKIRLKKREKSPQKKAPLKPKALNFDGQLEVSENVPTVSDSLLSESACSPDESKNTSRSDLDASPRSNVSKVGEVLKPDSRTVNGKVFIDLENFKSKKSQLEVERYPWKQHSAEELIKWTKRLEEKENHLKELEKQTVSAAVRVKSRLMRSLKNAKASVKDRSTSPFQFQDTEKTTSVVSPPDATEVKKSSTISEEIDANPETEVTERTESVLEKFQSSASEDIPEQFSKKILTSRTSEYQSENFESPSSSETARNKPAATPKSDWGSKGIAIKMSLSPRMQGSRRRYSSGSDDSVNLSHTETASEQSDLESRIAALHEQLRKRKLEAERLRREQKKAQRERLKVKEQCLLNQIQAYDAYIQKKKQELEREYEHSNQTVMKPLIKQPRVAEKRRAEMMTPKSSEREKREPEAKAEVREERTPDKESDGEVVEQIKIASDSIGEVLDESESIKEQMESKSEEGEKSKATESSFDAELSPKESLDEGRSTSASDSVPAQDAQEGSQSESEDQSISVKTTLQSPEKQEADGTESPTVAEDASQSKQTTDEDFYRCESFESDAEERLTGRSDATQIGSEPSEATKEVATESAAAQENRESEDGDLDSREEEDGSEREGTSKRAEEIADSIIMGLILESVNVFCNKKVEAEKKLAEQSRLSLEILSSFLAREIISEAVEDMIRIYKKKAGPEEDGAGRRTTSEVRRRITEMMSQAGEAREPKRPREAAHDASPPDGATDEGAGHERFLQSPSLFKSEKPENEVFTEGECNDNDSNVGTYGQEWIDDDFGLSETRREAEELRLQQLQIEQEIQQLQAQQKQVPYFYLREIPNKPPPPYTPPAKPFTEIPASESEIMTITLDAVRILTDEMSKGKPIDVIEPDWEYYGDAPSENFKCYKFFLFDLAKHIISDLVAQQERKVEVLPWMRTRKRLSKYKYQKIERTFGCLNEFARRQIFVLFGFGKKVSKESLIVRWIKKKRDHVDEILVGESQEEEAQWTQYDEDQVTVKNEVTMSILDSLLEDTAQVISAICDSKMRKEKRNRFALSQ